MSDTYFKFEYEDANGNSEIGVSLNVSLDAEDGNASFSVDAGNDGAHYTVNVARHRDTLRRLGYALVAAAETFEDLGFYDGYGAGPWSGDWETGEEDCY